MPKLTREHSLMIGSKEIRVDEILKSIIYLPASEIKDFFHDLGINIPREIRIAALRDTLREKVAETRKNRLSLADELNYRLSWFPEFTETQLENLIVFYDDPKLDREFLILLWTELLHHLSEKAVGPNEMKKLFDMSVRHVKQVGLDLPNMKTYNKELDELFFDQPNRIDGLTAQKIRPVLYKSSTLSEIRDLGTKYGVNVPKRLKKNELAEIIIKELEDRQELTPQLAENIRGMSVLLMQRFAIDNDIKASTELKKEEIIEYILANAQETKETYYVPETEAYEMEVDQLQTEEQAEPLGEDIITEAKMEDPIIQVATKVEETLRLDSSPKLEQALKEIANELRLLRETLINIEEKRAVYASIEKHQPAPQPPTVSEKAKPFEAKETLPQEPQPVPEPKEKPVKEPKVKKVKVKKEKVKKEKVKKIKPPKKEKVKKVKSSKKKNWILLIIKWVVIIALVYLLLYVGFSLVTYLTNIAFLDSIANRINRINFLGKGTMDFMYDFYRSLGLKQA